MISAHTVSAYNFLEWERQENVCTNLREIRSIEKNWSRRNTWEYCSWLWCRWNNSRQLAPIHKQNFNSFLLLNMLTFSHPTEIQWKNLIVKKISKAHFCWFSQHCKQCQKEVPIQLPSRRKQPCFPKLARRRWKRFHCKHRMTRWMNYMAECK